jgi:hypothetical protein
MSCITHIAENAFVRKLIPCSLIDYISKRYVMRLFVFLNIVIFRLLSSWALPYSGYGTK